MPSRWPSHARAHGGGGGAGRGPCFLVLLLLGSAVVAGLSLGITRQGGGAAPGAATVPGLWRPLGGRSGGSGGGSSSGGDTIHKAGIGDKIDAQPQHKFLMFFSGHQGSSALADMLGAHESVLIPGFEPLDFPGITAAQKLAFLEATFSFPASEAGFSAWRAALEPVRGMRLDRKRLREYGQLAGKSVAGFKMRPYALDTHDGERQESVDVGSSSDSSSSGEGGSSSSSGGPTGLGKHTAMSGVSPAAVRALLHRHNVSVVLTLRRNRLKEALSWYRARQLGVSQFQAIKAAKAAAAGTAAGPQHAERGDGAIGASTVETSTASSRTGNNTIASNNSGGVKVSVDIPQVLTWLNFTDAANERLQQAAAYLGRPTLTVWYEDFLADPLREAQRAAEFVGVPRAAGPAGPALQLSAKFRKAGPDAVQDWVANYGELCSALDGTLYAQHLDMAACAAQLLRPFPSTSGAASHSHTTVQTAPAPTRLLDSWCVAKDKEATGWAALTESACMRRFRERQEAAAAAVRNGTGTLLFKHVHKAGGSTLCRLALANMAAESARLPFRKDWDTNCVPYEAFLGAHPAVSGGGAVHSGTMRALEHLTVAKAATGDAWPQEAASSSSSSSGGGAKSYTATSRAGSARALQAFWLGGACWLGFATPVQLRALPQHFRPLTFVASEGPLPNALPLDVPYAIVTMLREPLDRVLSSYRWWQFMMQAMPQAPAECHAYSAPANASLAEWLAVYPDNFMTRELVGRTALYQGRQRPLTESDLLTAQQRLHYFAAVLLLEAPETSMALLRSRFGWQTTGWEEHRAGSRHGSNAVQELPAALLERLRKDNQFDLRLYAYARLLHDTQVAAADGNGPGA